MHPERALFLAGKLTAQCARYIYLCRSEVQGNRERARTNTNAADRHLDYQNPAPHYPRRVGKTNNETEKLWKFSSVKLFPYKKTISRGNFHFARRPAFRTAETVIPNLFHLLEPMSRARTKESSVLGLWRAFSIAYSLFS